jgi:hypothetical protein
MLGLHSLRHALEDPFYDPSRDQSLNDEYTGDRINLQQQFDDLKDDLDIIMENRSTVDVDKFDVVQVGGRDRVVSIDSVFSKRNARLRSFSREGQSFRLRRGSSSPFNSSSSVARMKSLTEYDSRIETGL